MSCLQPTAFIDTDHPNHVCLLSKLLYGIKQAPRAWYQRFSGELQTIDFTPTSSDNSFFIYKRGHDMAYLLLYIDDIVLTASSITLLQDISAPPSL
jgi:hypothetical protein